MMKKIGKMTFGKKISLAFACALVACLGAGAAFATNESNDNLGMIANDTPYEASFAVTVDPCEDVVVYSSGEKTDLAAFAADEDGNEVEATYQWQILVDEEAGLWVDVQGQDDEAVGLTVGMVNGALNDDGVAQVRCVATSVDGEAVSSDAVEVTVADADVATPLADGASTGYVLMRSVSAGVAAADANAGIALADAGNGSETPATYSIIINYVFADGGIAADSYTATLAAGSSFSTTVNHPTVQGYLPYVGEETESSSNIEVNVTNIQLDITYTVTYKPTNVNYTVIHYQQNVDNDNYTIAETETLQGLTKSTVPEVAKDYPGFYALLYEKPAIAADGSTIVEVYYDRNYYLMNFDLDGGYGVEPIYARYGSALEHNGTPVKAGHTFGGWTLDGKAAETMPTTMPAENCTYKAVWKTDATAKVTIVFWGENANDEEYSYIQSLEKNVKPGSEFTYSESGSLVCGQTVHVHDTNCGYACNKTEHGHDEDCYQLICSKEVHEHSGACYGCGQESHTHSTGCYAGVGSAFELSWGEHRVSGNESNGSIGVSQYASISWNGREWHDTGNKYIYINGTWYKYTGSTSVGGTTTSTCGKTEQAHNHTENCITCGKEAHAHTDYTGTCYKLTCSVDEHSHSDECQYNCGETAHSHTSECYMEGVGLDSSLWTFVKSDTVTVAADGSSVVNVYYERTTFVLHFRNTNSSIDDHGTIEDKWGADIRARFNQKSTDAGTALWSESRNGSDPWTSFLDEMPSEDRTYYGYKSGSTKQTATYYGESLDGSWEILYTSVAAYGSTLYVGEEDKVSIKGFTYSHGTENGDRFNGAGFYYTRNSYTLVFNDGYNDVRSESVKYEAPLNTYKDYVPDVPSAYEPGSVVFGGWYLNPECTGVKYDLTTHTMPAENILLYAKWVPVEHYVMFYLDKDAYSAGSELETHPVQTVAHGNKLNPVPAAPINGSYNFVGWFYMDGDVEKAFDFANMPITKNMKVYAKWSSNVLKTYFVYYKDQETGKEIAEPTTGSGLAGITKTFDAKGGEDLHSGYQEGYFPLVQSHSMTLDINATEDNNTNTFTFYYVQKDAVPYTVKYLILNDDGSTTPAFTNDDGSEYIYVNSENRKAVVTETFKVKQGYMPDAYQKRLIVDGTDGATNEIVFYYTADTEHAYYKISHYTENIDGGWTEYASSEAIGNIGKSYSAEPLTISGFTYNEDASTFKGELTAEGLHLKLFYDRNSYPYMVRYLEEGSGKQLAEPKLTDENEVALTGKYSEVVSESAIDITDYECVTSTPQSLVIRIEEGSTPALNVVTFYYKEKEVTINYQVVGPEGCGMVDPASETLKVKSGDAGGSTASANEDFRFVGWYDNANCSGDPLSTDAKYVPVKVEGDDGIERNISATYYAKFEYDVTTLTIEKVLAEGTTVDPGQTFIFTVVGIDESNSDISLDVTVFADERGKLEPVTIADLPVGNYKVTENVSWSWRYVPDLFVKMVEAKPSNENKVTFTNTKNKDKWLDSDCFCENTFSSAETSK